VSTNFVRQSTIFSFSESNTQFTPLTSLFLFLFFCRWQIEGWFKTAKHRFGLHRFAQQTKLGMYRWLILSLIAYLLAHWAYLSTGATSLPDWGQMAELALHTLFPQLVVCVLLTDILRLQPLLQQQGIDIKISWCKM